MSTENELLLKLAKRVDLTPDWVHIKNHKYIPLFVYDQLMTTWNTSLMIKRRGAEWLGQGKTAAEGYGFYKFKFNFQTYEQAVPVIIPNNVRSASNRGLIKGDVYAVSPLIILVLDKKYNNGTMFNRKKISVGLIDQRTKDKKHIPYIQAFAYIGDSKFWNGMIGGEAVHIGATIQQQQKAVFPKGDRQIRIYDRFDPDPSWTRDKDKYEAWQERHYGNINFPGMPHKETSLLDLDGMPLWAGHHGGWMH